METLVSEVLASTQILDVHTHLFAPHFGSIGLWGIDELLTYHYLEAEVFRFSTMRPAEYWSLSRQQQADHIWQKLFVENSPLSEATRGVVAVLQALGLETNTPDLTTQRAFFRAQKIEDYFKRVFQLAGISAVVMTNDPLDPAEAAVWNQGHPPNPCYHPVLRLDRILNDWHKNYEVMAKQGYKVDKDAAGSSQAEARRFVMDWAAKMKPVYMAVSLEDTFLFPAGDIRTKLLTHAILPACRELGIPLSLMIGVRRQVNPALRLGGDGVGLADLRAVEHLCREFPDNRFLCSVLSRENQHELVVYARKFANLMPFGCWWFLNNPSIVEEITRERMEMLGPSFVPQHSDARILEQVIYKWRNTRRIMAQVLGNSYKLLAEDGRPVTREQVTRDVKMMFQTNFERFVSGK